MVHAHGVLHISFRIYFKPPVSVSRLRDQCRHTGALGAIAARQRAINSRHGLTPAFLTFVAAFVGEELQRKGKRLPSAGLHHEGGHRAFEKIGDRRKIGLLF